MISTFSYRSGYRRSLFFLPDKGISAGSDLRTARCGEINGALSLRFHRKTGPLKKGLETAAGLGGA
ncbi:hypothetical protein [Novacetimonas maltaceti]|uniref:hypothetical protein n=1 Tax=Novacetimonas maltaceti TaxID=1203393 RepID=UPI0011AF656E|nr:hypothetical protein [Novacetimonas maltaceti]